MLFIWDYSRSVDLKCQRYGNESDSAGFRGSVRTRSRTRSRTEVVTLLKQLIFMLQLSPLDPRSHEELSRSRSSKIRGLTPCIHSQTAVVSAGISSSNRNLRMVISKGDRKGRTLASDPVSQPTHAGGSEYPHCCISFSCSQSEIALHMGSVRHCVRWTASAGKVKETLRLQSRSKQSEKR